MYLASQEKFMDESTRNWAVAVTLTELQFRPLWFRLLEYGYALFLLSFGGKAGSVSVGIAQISLRHYSEKLNFGLWYGLVASTSARVNIRLCGLLIAEIDNKDALSVARLYNGNATKQYYADLEKNFRSVCKVSRIR